MKKNHLKILIFTLLLIVGQVLMAQPPDPPGDPSQGGNEVVGGNAPIGGGVGMLMLMALAYGSKKIYKHWKREEVS